MEREESERVKGVKDYIRREWERRRERATRKK
jgi:hypothetical protein